MNWSDLKTSCNSISQYSFFKEKKSNARVCFRFLALKKKRSKRRDDTTDIFEVEAVGPLLVLHNFGAELVNCLWLLDGLSQMTFRLLLI